MKRLLLPFLGLLICAVGCSAEGNSGQGALAGQGGSNPDQGAGSGGAAGTEQPGPLPEADAEVEAGSQSPDASGPDDGRDEPDDTIQNLIASDSGVSNPNAGRQDAGDQDAGQAGAGSGGGGSGGGAGSGGKGAQDSAIPDAGLQDAADPDAGDGAVTWEEFCEGGGPPVKVVDTRPTTPGDMCTGTIARRLFDHSLCTCEEVSFAGYLKTQSFDSSLGPAVVKAGAPVGVNDALVTGSYIDVGGSFTVKGDLVFAGPLDAGGDIKLGKAVTILGVINARRDLWLGQPSIITAGSVGRDLYTQTGDGGPLTVAVGGSRVQTAIDIPPPCECEPDELLDIDSIVDDGKLNNDNNHPDVMLDPAALNNLGFATVLDLPCGRFFLESIGGVGAVTINVTGRTALFIEGDVSTVGAFQVNFVGPDAELDIFIKGDLNQIGYGSFGNADRPADLRVYVGGSGDILYLGYQPFAGNLYAPKARLASDGYLPVNGSVFVRDIMVGGYIDITYDRHVLDVGDDEECYETPEDPPPPPEDAGVDAGIDAGADAGSDAAEPPEEPDCYPCDGTCPTNLTCIEGYCAPCQTDLDCCEPLVCYEDGRCGALLF